MSAVKLIIDDREKATVGYFDVGKTGAGSRAFDIEVKRIHVGDYAICDDGAVVAIIERKTWKDLAASFKDGRKENVNNLLELRKSQDCCIFYLIEGPARASPTTKFGRIPYKNLQAHLDHLMLRDGIGVLHSKNEQDTAARLQEFCQNYTTLRATRVRETKAKNPTSGGRDDPDDPLTTRTPKSDMRIIYDMWCSVPHITNVTASLFIDKYSLADLILGKISKDDIYTMRYPSGAILGKRAEKIIKIADHDSNTARYSKILECIPGVSKTVAVKVLEKYSMQELLTSTTASDIAEIKKTSKLRIGPKVAERIVYYLRFKRGDDATSLDSDED